MSINELEAKCRELRQLQNLIEEAQAEAETIKDAIKAAMGASEAIQAGEYKITWKHNDQSGHHGSEKGPAGRGCAVHERNHRAPLFCGMMEAVVTIAGAVYLTEKLFALVDWIEQRKALPRTPASRAEKDL